MCLKVSTHKLRGFTLVEILVVVVLVAIAMSVVVGSFTGVDQQQELHGYMERLTLRLELARDKAMQNNREWGVYVDHEGVRFAEFDEINGRWDLRAERPFKHEEYSLSLEFRVEVESFAGINIADANVFANKSDGLEGLGGGLGGGLGRGTKQSNNSREELGFPDLVIFSSGETTPFTIIAEPKEWRSEPWQIASDGFTRAALTRVGVVDE